MAPTARSGYPLDAPPGGDVTYRIRLHYRYTYTGPVSDVRQRLIVVPPNVHGDQRLLESSLEVRGVDGRTGIEWGSDEDGNQVCRVRAERVEQAIDFETRYVVHRAESFAHAALRLREEQRRRFLGFTALTMPDERLELVAREISNGADDPRVLAERANDWASKAIGYQFGITGVFTPAAMALYLGHGVCQDFAHLMLVVLRLVGVPARYVSGHLLGEGPPHAWVEALLAQPDDPGSFEVVAYDPTNHRRAGLTYVTVAVGRDFADVTPTSGVYTGRVAGRLSSSKQAEIIRADSSGVGARSSGERSGTG